MKKWLMAAAFMLAVVSTTSAQGGKVTTQKIGFVNLKKVLDSLPARDSAVRELKAINDYFTIELQTMQKEFEQQTAEYDAYIKSQKVEPMIKEMKEGSLENLRQRIYAFEQGAQEKVAQKQTEVFTPIINDIKASAAEVAKAKGYTQVIDVSNEILIYNANPGDDITQAVVKYIRSRPAKAATPPSPIKPAGGGPGINK